MNKTIQRGCIVAILSVVLSCKDQGDLVDHLRLLEVVPSPGATAVDKGEVIHVRFDRGVQWNEAAKIRMRYLDDTSQVNSYSGCGLVPPIVDLLCVGPFIWKPGRTVEVTIPKEMADPEGNTLEESFTFRFTTARDTVPFDVVATLPAQDDTVSIGMFADLFGMLRFSDYVHIADSVLTIDPPATVIVTIAVIIEGRNGPEREVRFWVRDLQPFVTYTITIPARVTDYEGQTLPGDRHLVFHTKP